MTGYREPGLTREQHAIWDDLPGVHHPDPFDAYDAAEAAQWDELPYPRPQGDRCPACGYRTDAAGHKTHCESETTR